jgi:hypothetical protein
VSEEREFLSAPSARTWCGLRVHEGRHREPGAAAADQYWRWDESVAIHRLIQSVNTPDAFVVNFGHGGLGAYGFFPGTAISSIDWNFSFRPTFPA